MYLTPGEKFTVEDISGDWRRQSCRNHALILPPAHLRHMYISGFSILELGEHQSATVPFNEISLRQLRESRLSYSHHRHGLIRRDQSGNVFVQARSFK